MAAKTVLGQIVYRPSISKDEGLEVYSSFSRRHFDRTKLFSDVRIGTSSGVFHCDDLLACVMLKCLPENQNAVIMRTNHQEILDRCDIVVGAGKVYNPVIQRYDHSQVSFVHTMHSLNPRYPWKVKLSTAGLIFSHFGHRIIRQLVKTPAAGSDIEDIFCKVYENFIMEIDAIENGVQQNCGRDNYKVYTDLCNRVAMRNKEWEDEEEVCSQQEKFSSTFMYVGEEFELAINHYSSTWLRGKQVVYEAVANRYKVHKTGVIIELPGFNSSWLDHLAEVEEKEKVNPLIYFIIYPNRKGTWHIRCVPVVPNSSEYRILLKFDWRAVPRSSLPHMSGIAGCIFVHIGGYIGENETREGVLKMAEETLSATFVTP